MRWLLFLSRLAFISGVCILIWLVLAMSRGENNELFSSTVIIIGYAMGAVLLPATNLSYLVMLILKKKMRPLIPGWLITANVIFLFVLIYYIFYLNDPYYHKK